MSEDSGSSISSTMRQMLARNIFKAHKHSLLYRSLIRSQNAVLQKSSVTTENPQNLPLLPVPKLEDTIVKYLTSVRPLLNDDEYCQTKSVAEDFQCGNIGCTLQTYIERKAACTYNWLEDWWLNTAYLGYRDPVVVYSSPGQSLPFQTFKNDDQRLRYTANLISAAASYKMLIDEKKIPVEKFGKSEIDMSPYDKIFGTIRIPCVPIDCLQYFTNSEHIIIARRNHFFKLQLFANCKPLSVKQIYQQLRCIMSQTSVKECPVGILTSDQRDNWASAYCELMALNPTAVAEIQQSLFLVCLDDGMPGCVYPNLETEGALQFIHGGGSYANSGNRWFDKTIQFIIGCTGAVGISYEHSPTDGQPIAVMVDYIVDHMKKNGSASVPDNCCCVQPQKLCFRINDSIRAKIRCSEENIDKLASNLQVYCFKFEDYGTEFIKSQKLSPDSYIQMAMQFAFYRMFGIPAAHYESASTRLFVGGRTETIRSCSIESVLFAQSMLDCCLSDICRVNALRDAIKGHKKYASEAMKGCGVDRHLLGLKLASRELGCDLPAIFCDIGYIRSTHFRLTTSQVATKCGALMTYGPVVEDGFGLCYNPRKSYINFGLSAWKSCCETNIEQFQCYLVQSLCDMKNLLCNNPPSKM